jgi:hypothetical protein
VCSSHRAPGGCASSMAPTRQATRRLRRKTQRPRRRATGQTTQTYGTPQRAEAAARLRCCLRAFVGVGFPVFNHQVAHARVKHALFRAVPAPFEAPARPRAYLQSHEPGSGSPAVRVLLLRVLLLRSGSPPASIRSPTTMVLRPPTANNHDPAAERLRSTVHCFCHRRLGSS